VLSIDWWVMVIQFCYPMLRVSAIHQLSPSNLLLVLTEVWLVWFCQVQVDSVCGAGVDALCQAISKGTGHVILEGDILKFAEQIYP